MKIKITGIQDNQVTANFTFDTNTTFSSPAINVGDMTSENSVLSALKDYGEAYQAQLDREQAQAALCASILGKEYTV